MLWPFVLPFKITFWALTALVAVATALGPRLGWPRGKTFSYSLIASMLVFVPSCTAVMRVVDAQRFGVFDIDSHAVLEDPRVAAYLPPTARSITIDKAPTGFRARFKIRKSDLDQWFNAFWQQFGSRSIIDRDDPPASDEASKANVDFQFEGLNFDPPAGMNVRRGPTASDGAGFELWYDAESETAYQRASYF